MVWLASFQQSPDVYIDCLGGRGSMELVAQWTSGWTRDPGDVGSSQHGAGTFILDSLSHLQIWRNHVV